MSPGAAMDLAISLQDAIQFAEKELAEFAVGGRWTVLVAADVSEARGVFFELSTWCVPIVKVAECEANRLFGQSLVTQETSTAVAVEVSEPLLEAIRQLSVLGRRLAGRQLGDDPTALARPSTLGEAHVYLATWNLITNHLGLGTAHWLTSAREHLPRPQWAAPKAWSLYRVEDILAALRRGAPTEFFDNRPPQEHIIKPELRKHLKAPDFVPKWASRASVRPEPVASRLEQAVEEVVADRE